MVNPKEYIKLFESDTINKRHKGVHKAEESMELCSFDKRINSVKYFEMFGQFEKDTVNQSRFTVKNNEIILETIEKCKFAQMNDKRYYFEDGIISLPFYHPYLNEINEQKQIKKKRLKTGFLKKKKIKYGKKSTS